MSRRSEGAFDITYAAMRGLWKFDEDLEKRIPPAAEIERRRQLINYRDVIVDAKKHTVRLRRAGMKLGLGGIAKGYAVDRCAEVLRRHGFDNFMVQAGGDLFVSGSKGTAPWMVGVRDPRGGPRAIIAKMAIRDHAFSTAGDYERAFVLDGKRYHHIIDPKTGYPATASRGVTIFAPTAFLADALDDAVFILGPQARDGAGRLVPGLLGDDRRRRQQGLGVEGARRAARAHRPADGGTLSMSHVTGASADVAIVGGGIMGCAVALRLAQRGLRGHGDRARHPRRRGVERRRRDPGPADGGRGAGPAARARACAAARFTRRWRPSCTTPPGSTSATRSRACSRWR